MNSNNPSYNYVVRELAERLSNLLAETLYAAGHLHLMNTNPAEVKQLRESGAAIVVDEHELLINTDPNVRRIMQAHKEAEQSLKELQDYWITTPDWANGEEL